MCRYGDVNLVIIVDGKKDYVFILAGWEMERGANLSLSASCLSFIGVLLYVLITGSGYSAIRYNAELGLTIFK